MQQHIFGLWLCDLYLRLVVFIELDFGLVADPVSKSYISQAQEESKICKYLKLQ